MVPSCELDGQRALTKVAAPLARAGRLHWATAAVLPTKPGGSSATTSLMASTGRGEPFRGEGSLGLGSSMLLKSIEVVTSYGRPAAWVEGVPAASALTC